MKNIILCIWLVLLVSCSKETDYDGLIQDRGGVILFDEAITSNKHNFLELNEDSIIFSENIHDPNNNATAYTLSVMYDHDDSPGTAILVGLDFLTITSFPNKLEISLKMVLEALNLTLEDLILEPQLNFVATVTTPIGTFVADEPDFEMLSGVFQWVEFATKIELSLVDGNLVGDFHPAFVFDVSFFVPPPKKIRGTSFEEPFAVDDPSADYIRPDSQGPTDEGEMFNHPDERHVMHIAKGNGVDDEIGFRSYFFENTYDGFYNEEIGVTRKTSDVNAYVDGVQGFQLEDVDGLWRLVFDKVTVPSTVTRSGVQISVFFRDTSWENSDTFHAYVNVENVGGTMETIDLLDISGAAIKVKEDKWILVDTGFLENISAYQLILDSEMNSSSEEIYFDRMLVYEEGE